MHQLVEVIHHTLHDLCFAKIEFVLNLRYFYRLQAVQISLEGVDLEYIEFHLEIFEDGSWSER